MKVNFNDWYNVEPLEVRAGRLHGDLNIALKRREKVTIYSKGHVSGRTLRWEPEGYFTGKATCKSCLCFLRSLPGAFPVTALNSISTDLLSIATTNYLRLHTLSRQQAYLAVYPTCHWFIESHIHTPIPALHTHTPALHHSRRHEYSSNRIEMIIWWERKSLRTRDRTGLPFFF